MPNYGEKTFFHNICIDRMNVSHTQTVYQWLVLIQTKRQVLQKTQEKVKIKVDQSEIASAPPIDCTTQDFICKTETSHFLADQVIRGVALSTCNKTVLLHKPRERPLQL